MYIHVPYLFVFILMLTLCIILYSHVCWKTMMKIYKHIFFLKKWINNNNQFIKLYIVFFSFCFLIQLCLMIWLSYIYSTWLWSPYWWQINSNRISGKVTLLTCSTMSPLLVGWIKSLANLLAEICQQRSNALRIQAAREKICGDINEFWLQMDF